jgi:hypothetical protein
MKLLLAAIVATSALAQNATDAKVQVTYFFGSE